MAMNVHYAYSHPSNFMDSKSLRGKMYAYLLNASKRVQKYLVDYVATWNHKPVWNLKGSIGYKTGDIFVAISTDDQIFWWLEEGTSVRYATMTDDFVPKTAPRRLKSGPGRGGVKYVDTFQPKPGIEAREILPEIAALDAPKFQSDILKVTANITFLPPYKTLP